MLRWIPRLGWKFVLLGLLSVSATALNLEAARGAGAGTVCAAQTDNKINESSLGDFAVGATLYNTNNCEKITGLIDINNLALIYHYAMIVIINTNNDGSPTVINNLRIDLGTAVSDVTVNGAPYVSSTNILITTLTTLTVQYEFGGNVLHFVVTVDPVNHTLSAFTVQAGPAPDTGPTESELLASQQSFFTQLIMSHQSGNLVSGVGSNLDGLFNGNGLAPFVSESGFAFQSAGAANWYAKRLAMAKARKQPAALDILARQSGDAATRADTTANLMAYLLSNDSASKETIEKLDGVAKDDLYAADATPLDDDNVFQSPWNVWVKGSWSVYEAHDSAAFDGHMVDVVGGIDYRLSDDLIVGVLGGYGVADFDTLTAGTAGSFDSDGVHAGVYLGKRLAPNLLLDALFAYTASDYDNRSGTTTGFFSAHRVTFAAHLKGNIDWGMVTVQPTIGLMYASEKQDAYTDSAAIVHAARTVTAGRLSIGPKFIFQPMENEFGTTQFWFAAKGEYDFSNQSTSANASLPDLSDVASVRLQSGVNVAMIAGAMISLQADISGLGSGEYLGYGGTARFVLPF